MIDVFLSKPTKVEEPFQSGLRIFETRLRDSSLRARTVGATDYPTENPLDKVLELMSQCRGAIILGYPQIEVRTGTLRGVALDKVLVLPTEWNHLEAALAYSRSLPLLFIHHSGVKRGVFDRGAIDAFLYCKDLRRPDWCMDDDVNGALQTWKRKVQSFGSARPDVGTKTSRTLVASGSEPSGDAVDVLAAVANALFDRAGQDEVARLLGMSEQRALFELEQLREDGYVSYSDAVSDAPPGYYLEQLGREILVRKRRI